MADIRNFTNVSRLLLSKAAQNNVPISAGFELTARCTMRCKMCYIVSQKYSPDVSKELSAEQWINLARQGVQQELLYVQITGGEAMLRSDFKEIYSSLHGMGLKISINTNATLFDDDFIEFFKKYPPAKFSVSIYGASNKTYEELCGLKNGYDIVTGNVKKLVSAGLNVKINLTLTKYNAGDGEEVSRFASSLKLPMNVMSFILPPEPSSCVGVNTVRLEAREAVRLYLRCNSVIQDGDGFLKGVSRIASKKLSGEETEIKQSSDKLRCHAGKASYWITWDGKMHPCVNLPYIEAYPLETGLKNAWDSIVRRTDEAVRFPKECTVCSMRGACFACPGYFYSETGDGKSFAPAICKYTENYIKSCRKLAEGGSIDEI